MIIKRLASAMAALAMTVSCATYSVNAADPKDEFPDASRVRKIVLNVVDVSGNPVRENLAENSFYVGVDADQHLIPSSFRLSGSGVYGHFEYQGGGTYICDLDNSKGYTHTHLRGDYQSGDSVYLKNNESYEIDSCEASIGYAPIRFSFVTAEADEGTLRFDIVQPLWGDLNLDNKVDVSDMIELQKTCAGYRRKINVGAMYGEEDHYEMVSMSMIDYYSDAGYVYDLRTKAPYFLNVFDRTEKNGAAVTRNCFRYMSYSPADLNGDRNVDVNDLILMQKYVAGWNVKLGKPE